jgi:hypothetical protein
MVSALSASGGDLDLVVGFVVQAAVTLPTLSGSGEGTYGHNGSTG